MLSLGELTTDLERPRSAELRAVSARGGDPNASSSNFAQELAQNFLHLMFCALHLYQSERRTIVRQTFKLKTRGRAIFSENDYRNVILIPPSATVTLVGGDIVEHVFVKIR